MEEHTVVAVDVAKAVFELAVSEEPGRVKLHRRLSRGEVEVFFAQARQSHGGDGSLRIGPLLGKGA